MKQVSLKKIAIAASVFACAAAGGVSLTIDKAEAQARVYIRSGYTGGYTTATGLPWYAVRAYYWNGPWSGPGFSYAGWDDYASRNGIGCRPGTVTEIYGFVPLTDKEKVELAKRYLPILDPAFIKVVKVDNQLVGFAIGMPDISEGIKRSRGKLFPTGIFHIIRSSRRSKRLVMMLGGILKEFRGQGVDVLMGARILDSAIKKGMKTIDSHLVLETNSPMRAEYERLGGKVVKRFRIYQKNL